MDQSTWKVPKNILPASAAAGQPASAFQLPAEVLERLERIEAGVQAVFKQQELLLALLAEDFEEEPDGAIRSLDGDVVGHEREPGTPL